MIFTNRLLVLIGTLIALGGALSRAAAQEKYTPGHYIAVRPGQDLTEVTCLQESAVKGIIKRYTWVGLEPEEGSYGFEEIAKDLDFLASMDKQLVVFLTDKTFSSGDPNPIPPYMKSHSVVNIKGGITGLKWDPVLIERQVALCAALSKDFDASPHFEGLAYQESAPSVSQDKLKELGYTPELMRDGLTKLLIDSSKAFPRSRIFWFMNFLPGNRDYLDDIAEAVTPYRVVMGGPDILPCRDALREQTPLYQKFAGRLKLFGSAQNDSYRHHKDDRSNGAKAPYQRGQKPIHPGGYVPMEDIFKYGRDEMKLNYVFWTYNPSRGRVYPGDPKPWTFNDALEVMRNYPEFNQ